MERMFVDPYSGDMKTESELIQDNIDFDTMFEVFDSDNGLIFDIVPENLEKMRFKDHKVLKLLTEFARTLAVRAFESDDPEEAEEWASTAAYVSKVMMEKLTDKKFPKH